jgi:hypothetical protein
MSQLPADLKLFIATPSAIHTYDQSSRKPIFECATGGIVNARAAKDNSSLLAVADSHLVLLHDPTRGTDRKYRLKNREVSNSRPLSIGHWMTIPRENHDCCSSLLIRARCTSPLR